MRFSLAIVNIVGISCSHDGVDTERLASLVVYTVIAAGFLILSLYFVCTYENRVTSEIIERWARCSAIDESISDGSIEDDPNCLFRVVARFFFAHKPEPKASDAAPATSIVATNNAAGSSMNIV